MASNTPVQSKPLAVKEGPQCGFEESVDISTANECVDEAAYHYDPVDRVCSPDVVVKVEYKETKKKIRKIVKLDERKILANRARKFQTKPKKEEKKRVEQKTEKAIQPAPQPQPAQEKREEISAGSGELHIHGVNPEVVSALIEQHEEAVARPDLLSIPAVDLSGHIFYQPRFNETETSSREVRRSRPQDEPEEIGCSESGTVLSESSLRPLLGVALFSGEKGFRSLLAESIEADRASGGEIDFVVVAVQRQIAFDNGEGESQRVKEEKSAERGDFGEGPSAPMLAQSYSQAYFVFSPSDFSSFSNPILSSLPEQGALVFRFDSLPVADRNVSALVVLFPALVSPREEAGTGRTGLEGGATRAIHTKVEPGSNSQSSKDSKHSGGHGEGRDRNQRDSNREPNDALTYL